MENEIVISIDSPVFNGLLSDLDKEIKRAVGLVLDNKFEGAEINIKLNIEMPEAKEEIAKIDEHGEIRSFMFQFRKPHFSHKITATLKKQYKKQGGYSENKQVLIREGEYIVAPIIKEEQLSIDQYEN